MIVLQIASSQHGRYVSLLSLGHIRRQPWRAVIYLRGSKVKKLLQCRTFKVPAKLQRISLLDRAFENTGPNQTRKPETFLPDELSAEKQS